MGRKNKQDVKVAKKAKSDLSNGMDNTLDNWREFARLAFGDTSASLTYMDFIIKRDGGDHKPRDTEGTMRLLLATIHDHPEMVENLGK
jgi:hypothetical protein